MAVGNLRTAATGTTETGTRLSKALRTSSGRIRGWRATTIPSWAWMTTRGSNSGRLCVGNSPTASGSAAQKGTKAQYFLTVHPISSHQTDHLLTVNLCPAATPSLSRSCSRGDTYRKSQKLLSSMANRSLRQSPYPGTPTLWPGG